MDVGSIRFRIAWTAPNVDVADSSLNPHTDSPMPPRPSPYAMDVPASVWWAAFAAVALILLIPLTLTEMPPLLDYPNHLARMEILAHGADDPALSRIYQADWRILPNIAIDAAMPAVMRFLPLEVTGKIFLAAALLLPLLGVVSLHRAVFRVRALWPLAAALAAYNRLFFTGFMNFLIGAGLALLAATLWEDHKDGRALPRIAVASAAAIVIFFCHLIALGFYGLLLASLELARAHRMGRLTLRGFDYRRLGLLAIPFAVPAWLYLNAPISAAGADDAHGVIDWFRHYYWKLAVEPAELKISALAGPFLTYNRWLDAAALALAIGVIGIARVRHRLRVAAAPLGLMTLFLLAYPFTPFFLFGTGWIDQRLPIMAGFLLFAGTLPAFPTARTTNAILVALAVVLVARVAEIGSVWAGRDAQLADFRRTIAPVQPGDRVLVVQAEDNMAPSSMAQEPDTTRSMLYNDATMHLPALLVIERKAFWPLLFSANTKQPVKVLPPYSDLALPEGVPPWVEALPSPRPRNLSSAPYLANWRRDFDWVLLLWPGWTPNGYDLLPEFLRPAAAGNVAALYRIRKDDIPPGSSPDGGPK
jgi:hypothetical protein